MEEISGECFSDLPLREGACRHSG